MPVLYRVLRKTLRLALELYFVDIQATGQENIAPEAPVIFAANHPNSIMDSVILGTQTRRQIQYMARSGLFKNPLAAMLFDRCGVIPVNRAQDSSSDLAHNEDSFRRAYEVLEGRGCIGLFPEGQNSFERHVREIKTGTARIALEAEARCGFALGLTIVPVGLNFENRDRFLSSVLVRFGEPIDVSRYGELYESDPRAAVRALTDVLQDRLRDLTTHIDDQRHQDLVRDVHRIYGRHLLAEYVGDASTEPRSLRGRLFDEVRATPGPKPDLDERFALEQHIADAVAHFEVHRPEIVARVRMDIQRYKDHLRQVRLHHDFAERPPETLSRRKDALKFTAYALAFGPLAAWGFVHNALPYLITRALALRAPDEAIRAITGFAVGMLAFPLFYTAQAWALFRASGGAMWLTALYVLSLPVAGFFFLRYRRQLVRYRDRILARTLFRTHTNLVHHLIREREHIIALLEALKAEYLNTLATPPDEHDDTTAAERPRPEPQPVVEGESAHPS